MLTAPLGSRPHLQSCSTVVTSQIAAFVGKQAGYGDAVGGRAPARHQAAIIRSRAHPPMNDASAQYCCCIA